MQTESREPVVSGSTLPPCQLQPPKPKTGLYLGLAVLALLVINSLAVSILFSLIH
jgi:hypothetical protein